MTASRGTTEHVAVMDGLRGLAITGVVLSLRRASRWGFRLVLVAALLDVGLLVAAGASLVPA